MVSFSQKKNTKKLELIGKDSLTDIITIIKTRCYSDSQTQDNPNPFVFSWNSGRACQWRQWSSAVERKMKIWWQYIITMVGTKEETIEPKQDYHLPKTTRGREKGVRTVQCSAVQCSAVQYHTEQHGSGLMIEFLLCHCSTLQRTKVWLEPEAVCSMWGERVPESCVRFYTQEQIERQR